MYEIIGNQLVARVRLNDGPGNVNKGFKSEWMARKGHRLFVGGLGKVWTTNGVRNEPGLGGNKEERERETDRQTDRESEAAGEREGISCTG